jgi:hypothetical protein
VVGEYRGRGLVLKVVVESVGVYDGTVWLTFTTASLQINNRAGCSLVVHEKGNPPEKPEKRKEVKEIQVSDSRFAISGSPPEFVQRAQALIKLLIRQRTTMAVNQSRFFWTLQSKLPFITLEGSDLIWQQYDVVADTNELMSYSAC